MQRILEQKKSFYDDVTSGGNRWIADELNRNGISILPGFINNYDLVKTFYARYYSKQGPRMVLCGINPGRKGAGLTGVPFLDYKSVSTLLPIHRQDSWEHSAQFVKEIIDHFGAEEFFGRVYLTNISWFGFERRDARGQFRNVNYYDLPEQVSEQFIDGFVDEMDIVQPSVIIPLSVQTEKSLRLLQAKGRLPFSIGERLRHPYNASRNKKTEMPKYVQAISEIF